MARTTGRIKYSLKDRKYLHNGVDRDDLDMSAMIKLIRSDSVQERVRKRCIFGYYGHQLRELYGLKVPETVIDKETGKEIHLTPALVTIYLDVDDDGVVTHEQEFINNIAGNQAWRQFKADIGGFSSAFYSPKINGIRTPLEYHGMDYVLRPNYHHNRSEDAIFDSLEDYAIDPLRAAYLERSLCDMYDSLEQMDVVYEIAELKQQQAEKAQQALDNELKLKQRRIDRAKEDKAAKLQREKEIQASMLLDSLPFEELVRESQSFLTADVVKDEDEKDKNQTNKKPLAQKTAEALTRFL